MKVIGESVSGIGTSLYVPELGLTFDIGRCPSEAIGTSSIVCITHGHMDHIGQSAYLRATRAMMAMSAPHFFLPDYLESRFRAFMSSTAALDGSTEKFLPYDLTLVHREEKHLVKSGLWLQPLSSPHTIPMMSYVVWKDARKLKPEYSSLLGPELGKLRKSGVLIEDVTSVPVFAYTGDTTGKVYDLHPILLQVQTLAMEITFFQDYPESEALQHGHTHIHDVISQSDKFENREIVLVHHSARYDEKAKETALNSLPESLRKKSRWL